MGRGVCFICWFSLMFIRRILMICVSGRVSLFGLCSFCELGVWCSDGWCFGWNWGCLIICVMVILFIFIFRIFGWVILCLFGVVLVL